MKKRKGRLTRFFADTADMPENIFPGVPEINILRNSEAGIDGCKGILLYESEEIRLKMADYILCIRGEELSLKTYYGSHISVKGHIHGIDFEDL